MTEWTGRTLSKVRIERQIGRGGMAEVFLGMHTTLDRPVAVKILHAHLTESPGLLERFHAEAQAVARLRHPNIVHVLDFDVVDGRPYIVMELLEGLSLADYLRSLHAQGHSLPLAQIASITTAMASALDYAHAQKIVHRDVKPANVMLRRGSTLLRPGPPLPPDIEPVLTDFGVARIAGAGMQTASGALLGTPAYMSPEQIRGEAVDSRTDVYSLGIILYGMLAGRLPFEPDSETPASILYKQIHDPPPPLANTSRAVQAVVDRALAKDRERRYPRAGELAQDLQAAVGLPLHAQTSVRGSAARGSKHPALGRRLLRWALASVSGVILLSLVVLLVVSKGGLFGRAPGGSEPAVTRAASAAGLPGATSTNAAATPAAAATEQPRGFITVLDNALQLTDLRLDPPPPDRTYWAWLIPRRGMRCPSVRLRHLPVN
ncbi:MAG: serine/threonine-protein kinase [Chloroflexota bacterium]